MNGSMQMQVYQKLANNKPLGGMGKELGCKRYAWLAIASVFKHMHVCMSLNRIGYKFSIEKINEEKNSYYRVCMLVCIS